MNLPLDVDEPSDVDTGYYTVHIQIKDVAARFVDSPCPDHICEGFGWLSNEDQTATCLPARAAVSYTHLYSVSPMTGTAEFWASFLPTSFT